MALQAYDDDCCPGCGQPRTYAMDSSSKNRWELHTATCYSCAALDKASRDRGDKPAPAGAREFVTPDGPLAWAMRHPIHVPPFHT